MTCKILNFAKLRFEGKTVLLKIKGVGRKISRGGQRKK